MTKRHDQNPFDSKLFREWADDMRRRLIPHMRDSASVVMIAPNMDTKFDIEFALQIGASILLEKPLILLVDPDRAIPPKLRAIADKIIEGNVTTDADRIRDQIKEAMAAFGEQ